MVGKIRLIETIDLGTPRLYRVSGGGLAAQGRPIVSDNIGLNEKTPKNSNGHAEITNLFKKRSLALRVYLSRVKPLLLSTNI